MMNNQQLIVLYTQMYEEMLAANNLVEARKCLDRITDLNRIPESNTKPTPLGQKILNG